MRRKERWTREANSKKTVKPRLDCDSAWAETDVTDGGTLEYEETPMSKIPFIPPIPVAVMYAQLPP